MMGSKSHAHSKRTSPRPTPRCVSASPISDWAIHFVRARNPAIRQYFEEQPLRLPSDSILSFHACAFEVLAAQLGLGGLIPGFPDDFLRKEYEPDPDLLFEVLDKVDIGSLIALGEPIVAVALLKSELETAGAVSDVYPEHPEVLFENLLSWRKGFEFTHLISFETSVWKPEEVPFLPLFLESRLKFTTAVVFVEDLRQATKLQASLTSLYFTRLHEHDLNDLLSQTTIMWPGRKYQTNAVLDLVGFASIGALVIAETDVHLENKVLEALQYAARSAERLNTSAYDDASDDYCYLLAFDDIENPVAQFLVRSQMAVPLDDGRFPFRFFLDGDPFWRAGSARGKVAVAFMASLLTEMLGLEIFMHVLPE